jgi:hypothetical protein
MKKKIALKKVFGDVYFTAERRDENAYIYAQWFGVQSVETVKEGGYKLLEMMQHRPCPKLLNCNRNVIGAWDMALDWAEKEWTPQMKKAGLRCLAQVVPTSIFAAMTIESLIYKIDNEFEIRTFESDAAAIAWLRSVDLADPSL